MKYQVLFSGKNEKNIEKCLLKILPRMISVKEILIVFIAIWGMHLYLSDYFAYHIYLEYSYTHAWANSIDLNQTASKGDQGLHCLSIQHS